MFSICCGAKKTCIFSHGPTSFTGIHFATAPLGFVVSFLVLVGPVISCHRHDVSLPIKNLHVPLALNKLIHLKNPGWHPSFSSNLQSNSRSELPLKWTWSITRCFEYFCYICLTLSYHILPSVFPATTHFCMCLWCLLAFQPAQLHRRCVPWAPSCRTPCCPMSHGQGWQNLEESHAIHCGLFSSKEISCGKPNAIKTYHVAMWRWIFVQTLCRKSLGLVWGDWGHWVYHIASSHDSFRFFCNESMLSNVPQAGLIDWFPKQLIWIIWPMAPKIMPDGYRSQNG